MTDLLKRILPVAQVKCAEEHAGVALLVTLFPAPCNQFPFWSEVSTKLAAIFDFGGREKYRYRIVSGSRS